MTESWERVVKGNQISDQSPDQWADQIEKLKKEFKSDVKPTAVQRTSDRSEGQHHQDKRDSRPDNRGYHEKFRNHEGNSERPWKSNGEQRERPRSRDREYDQRNYKSKRDENRRFDSRSDFNERRFDEYRKKENEDYRRKDDQGYRRQDDDYRKKDEAETRRYYGDREYSTNYDRIRDEKRRNRDEGNSAYQNGSYNSYKM